jgi:hypothetical protein
MDAGGAPPASDDEVPIFDFEKEEDPSPFVVEEERAGPKFVDCPHCGEPNRPKAHRCRGCAKPLRSLMTDEERIAQARYRMRLRLAAAAAVALAGLVLLGIGLSFRGEPPKIEWSKILFAEVDRLFGPGSTMPDGKRAELWERVYAGRFVRWEGRVVEIEPASFLGGEGALLLRNRAGAGEPDVRLALGKAEIEKPGLAPGATVLYGGRLGKKPPGRPIPLAEGRVFTARKR